MKFLLLKIFKFLLFSIPCYLLFFFLWAFYVPVSLKPNFKYKIGANGHLHTRIRDIPNFKSVDLLIVGSSYAYRGFDPRVFNEVGLSTFVLGSSAQTPLQSKCLLSRHLKTLQPKKVIYAIHPKMFCIDGVESTLDLIANDFKTKGLWKLALTHWNVKVFNALIYKSVADHLPSVLKYSEPKDKEYDTYISGGYVETGLLEYQPFEFKNEKIEIRADQWNAFLDVLKMLKAENISVVLVFPPVVTSFYQSMTDLEVFNEQLSQLGYPYYNYNEPPFFTSTQYFYDEQHMLASGVQLFNKDFIQKLSFTNLTTPKHSYQ